MSETTHATERPRRSEARSVALNPEDPDVILAAFKTVLRYTITEAFGLVSEETLWVAYHLDAIFKPLTGLTPSIVPLAVRQEMLESAYSKGLEGIESERRLSFPMAADPTVLSADVTDWVAVMMNTVKRSYNLRPLTEASMTGQLTGVLRELGVGDPTHPRGSQYLPIDVRDRMASHRSGPVS